jgi:hypothetical protein
MRVESGWAKVPYKREEMLKNLSNLNSLKQFAASDLITITEDGKNCEVKMQGFPMVIKLKMANDPQKEGFLRLSAHEMPISFDLFVEIQAQEADDPISMRLVFDGKSINMFVKPMIEKPIKNFFGKLAEKIERHFEKKV